MEKAQIGPVLWLVAFVGSGIGLGQTFELLQLHAGPARYDTFFLCLLGYWANFLVGGLWVVWTGSWRRGRWTRRMRAVLVLSAVFDGAAQALNYVAQLEGGIMLFTIFNSSVTVFACLSAVLAFKARLRPLQWAGVLSIVFGLFVTAFPNPVTARHSFAWGLLCSMLGSVCLATSYPLAEAVFRLAPPGEAPSEEMACVCGNVVNVVAITMWSLAYTRPRWQEAVVAPIAAAAQPSVEWAVFGYALFALLVGVHSLAFWKAVGKLGTVPTAVSKGAQQAGVFLFAHILYCDVDPTECIYNNGQQTTTWSRMQKSVAFLACCGGVVTYSLGKKSKADRDGELPPASAADDSDDEPNDPFALATWMATPAAARPGRVRDAPAPSGALRLTYNYEL